jgi:hypothetical protein
MRPRNILDLLLLLLISAALPSCKSPTATTQPPAFTLILPDSTVAWGDSAIMRVIPAKPLNSSSVFTWSFGDSSSLVSRNDTIIHYYPDTGVFTVKVALNDTSNRSQLGTQSGTVTVAARHFNLALLQSMKYVEITWMATVRSVIDPSFSSNNCIFVTPGIKALTWNGLNFSMNSNWENASRYFDSATGVGTLDSTSEAISLKGNTDINFSEISLSSDSDYFVIGAYYNAWGQLYQVNGACSLSSSFISGNIPFKSGSDTDLVFEATRNNINGANYTYFNQSTQETNVATIQSTALWSNEPAVPFIRIRFHK